jgi:glutamyl-tRNA reductase
VPVTLAESPAGSLPGMKLAELQVVHLEGSASKLAEADLARLREGGEAWVIGTCQRTVIVALGRNARTQITERFPLPAAAQGMSGAEAYSFLLRFACGLESRLAGETEVFGQIKESWRHLSEARGALSRPLGPLVQALFQDAKEIRAAHLSKLGSASYGSQVRRVLGEASPGPTLLVGAGQLAKAVAPWLECEELLLWNRTAHKAHELARRVQDRHPQRVCRVLEGTPESELEAWSRAGDIIICVPADAARDAARISVWRARTGHAGRIVHLGLGESGDASWEGVSGLTRLTALYEMLRAQSDSRRTQLTHARRSCEEKAALRSLGSPEARTHGWEDRAAFATISP